MEEALRNDPPTSPALGACYIVGNSPTAGWSGKNLCLAGYTSGGWRFVSPQDGMNVYVKSTGTLASFRSGTWEIGALRAASVVIDGVQVIGSRKGAITAPSGGTNIDAESRTAINQMLTALRQHGLIES